MLRMHIIISRATTKNDPIGISKKPAEKQRNEQKTKKLIEDK